MIQAIARYIESKGFKVDVHAPISKDKVPTIGMYLANKTKHTRSGNRGIMCSVIDPNRTNIMWAINLNGLKVRLSKMILTSLPDVPVEKRRYSYDFSKHSLSDPRFFEAVDGWLL